MYNKIQKYKIITAKFAAPCNAFCVGDETGIRIKRYSEFLKDYSLLQAYPSQTTVAGTTVGQWFGCPIPNGMGKLLGTDDVNMTIISVYYLLSASTHRNRRQRRNCPTGPDLQKNLNILS